MKKTINRLLSLGLVLIASAALTVPVLASDAVVRREGTNGLVIETVGSGYTDTDLFNNFKDVMPGDERTETITIKNSVNGFDYVKLYIRAVPHDEQGNPLTYDEKFENEDGKDQANVDSERDETVATMADFLAQLSMKIYLVNADGTKETIFSATPDQSAQLTDNVLLGTFAKGKSAKLEAVRLPWNLATTAPTASAKWTGCSRSRASTTKSPSSPPVSSTGPSPCSARWACC